LSVMAQALIDGRIDGKTAGRLAVGLQTAAKLLRTIQRQGKTYSPQIKADERRLKQNAAAKEANEEAGGDEFWQPSTRWKNHDGQMIEKKQIMEIIPMRRVAFHAETAHAPPIWARAA
jgi:hypothetical protein